MKQVSLDDLRLFSSLLMLETKNNKGLTRGKKGEENCLTVPQGNNSFAQMSTTERTPGTHVSVEKGRLLL